MFENNKWYKSKGGSVYFKTGMKRAFGYKIWTFIDKGEWRKSVFVNFDIRLWDEITSPKVILEAINNGMKSIGYNNNVLISPFIWISNDIVKTESKPIKLKDYHFDLKNSDTLNLLLNYGELWLIKKNNPTGNHICILRDGQFSKIIIK